jgi:hypothetical protein
MLAFPSVSNATMQIVIDSTVITDNGAGDLNSTVGTIDFSGVYGTAAYAVVGRLTDTPGVSGIALSTYVLRLTNFSAQAVTGSVLGTPMNISIESNTFPAAIAGTASDNITALVGNASGLSVPANTDMLLTFASVVNDGTMFPYPISTVVSSPAPFGNPLFGGGLSTIAYPVSSHTTAVPPTIFPTLLGAFSLSLGQIDDRFIMPTSYDIGLQIAAVPEPSSLVLLGIASLGVILVSKNRRRASLEKQMINEVWK